MPLYENVFIARQDVSTTQVEALTEQFTELVKAGGGEVTKNEYWGLKNLAYKIKKNRKGHYTLLNIDAPSPAVLEMERNMRLNEDVLRFLTVRVEELEAEQSIVLRSKGMRDDRGPRGGRRFGGPPDRGGRGPRRDGPGRDGPRDGPRGDGPRGDGPRGDGPARDAKPAEASAEKKTESGEGDKA